MSLSGRKFGQPRRGRSPTPQDDDESGGHRHCDPRGKEQQHPNRRAVTAHSELADVAKLPPAIANRISTLVDAYSNSSEGGRNSQVWSWSEPHQTVSRAAPTPTRGGRRQSGEGQSVAQLSPTLTGTPQTPRVMGMRSMGSTISGDASWLLPTRRSVPGSPDRGFGGPRPRSMHSRSASYSQKEEGEGETHFDFLARYCQTLEERLER